MQPWLQVSGLQEMIYLYWLSETAWKPRYFHVKAPKAHVWCDKVSSRFTHQARLKLAQTHASLYWKSDRLCLLNSKARKLTPQGVWMVYGDCRVVTTRPKLDAGKIWKMMEKNLGKRVSGNRVLHYTIDSLPFNSLHLLLLPFPYPMSNFPLITSITSAPNPTPVHLF